MLVTCFQVLKLELYVNAITFTAAAHGQCDVSLCTILDDYKTED